jgi:ribosome-binding protein aMBF1 (putative translation factor)
VPSLHRSAELESARAPSRSSISGNILFWDISIKTSISFRSPGASEEMRKTVHTRAQRAFCGVLIEARQKAGLTQTELAQRLRKPQSLVAKIEAGERRVDIIEFLSIASALGEDAATLLKRLRQELGQS